MIEKKKITIPAKPARAAQPATTKVVEIHKCDLCKATINKSLDNRYGSGSSKCCICSREICRGKCMRQEYPDGGDYASNYCYICHGLWYGTYKEERYELERKHEREEEALERKIKKESLQTEV